VVTRVILDQDFCLVLADFGLQGRAFLETNPSDATFDRAVRDIVDGNVENVVAVIQFNPTGGYARDVTLEIARAVSELVLHDGEHPHESIRRFLDDYRLAYPPSLEAQVFQRWPPPAQGEGTISPLPDQTRRVRKASEKSPARSDSTRPKTNIKTSAKTKTSKTKPRTVARTEAKAKAKPKTMTKTKTKASTKKR
jgi:hypothetical protein